MSLPFSKNRLIPDADLEFRAVRSGGPGGQNVNKVATKAQLRFALAQTAALSDTEKARLIRQKAQKVTKDGDLLVTCDETRSLETNKQLALSRLASWLERACIQERPRLSTRPSRSAKRRRLEEKKARSRLKATRRASFD